MTRLMLASVMSLSLTAVGSRPAGPGGTEGRRHRPGLRAARHGRQDAQAVRLQGQDRRPRVVPQGLHRWLNGRVQVAPCERRGDSEVRRRVLHGERRRRRDEQEVRRPNMMRISRCCPIRRRTSRRRTVSSGAVRLRARRWTFYIGPDGKILFIDKKVSPAPRRRGSRGQARRARRQGTDQTEIAAADSSAAANGGGGIA